MLDRDHVQRAACARKTATSLEALHAKHQNTMHRPQEKLTGEIAKHDAKLVHQNLLKLRLRRDIDVFTLCFSCAVAEVSEFI